LGLHGGRTLGLWGGSDEIDRERPDDGHVFRAVALSQAGLIVGEDDIEHPVQLVLYAPMAA